MSCAGQMDAVWQEIHAAFLRAPWIVAPKLPKTWNAFCKPEGLAGNSAGNSGRRSQMAGQRGGQRPDQQQRNQQQQAKPQPQRNRGKQKQQENKVNPFEDEEIKQDIDEDPDTKQ